MGDMQTQGLVVRPLRIKIISSPEAKAEVSSFFSHVTNANLFEASVSETELGHESVDFDLVLSCDSLLDLKCVLGVVFLTRIGKLGKEIIVTIGDTHGNVEGVKKLYQNLSASLGDIFDFVNVIFLGDLVDRGI